MKNNAGEYLVHDESETIEFAINFAKCLKPSDIVLLKGDLGAGKTFLCRQIIRNLCGHNLEVASPTFNIMALYDAQDFTIYHCDFYRLKDKEEFYNLGLEEAFRSDLVLIEWPEIVEDIVPRPVIEITITILEENIRSIIWKKYD